MAILKFSVPQLLFLALHFPLIIAAPLPVHFANHTGIHFIKSLKSFLTPLLVLNIESGSVRGTIWDRMLLCGLWIISDFENISTFMDQSTVILIFFITALS